MGCWAGREAYPKGAKPAQHPIFLPSLRRFPKSRDFVNAWFYGEAIGRHFGSKFWPTLPEMAMGGLPLAFLTT